MTTKLDKTLKREIAVNDVPYILTFSPEGLKITEKGKRKGQEMRWEDLISGSVALAQGLKDSLTVARDQESEG